MGLRQMEVSLCICRALMSIERLAEEYWCFIFGGYLRIPAIMVIAVTAFSEVSFLRDGDVHARLPVARVYNMTPRRGIAISWYEPHLQALTGLPRKASCRRS